MYSHFRTIIYSALFQSAFFLLEATCYPTFAPGDAYVYKRVAEIGDHVGPLSPVLVLCCPDQEYDCVDFEHHLDVLERSFKEWMELYEAMCEDVEMQIQEQIAEIERKIAAKTEEIQRLGQDFARKKALHARHQIAQARVRMAEHAYTLGCIERQDLLEQKRVTLKGHDHSSWVTFLQEQQQMIQQVREDLETMATRLQHPWVSSRVEGVLVDFAVEPGCFVRQGEILFWVEEAF